MESLGQDSSSLEDGSLQNLGQTWGPVGSRVNFGFVVSVVGLCDGAGLGRAVLLN